MGEKEEKGGEKWKRKESGSLEREITNTQSESSSFTPHTGS